MADEENRGNLTAIKKFFEEGPSGRKVETAELKALTQEERVELGKMCKKELGW